MRLLLHVFAVGISITIPTYADPCEGHGGTGVITTTPGVPEVQECIQLGGVCIDTRCANCPDDLPYMRDDLCGDNPPSYRKCCYARKPDSACCSIYGDPHFRSFDGAIYDIQREGTFDLVSPCNTNEFNIAANFYRPRGTTRYTLVNSVSFEIGSDLAKLEKGPPLSASFNGNPVTTFPSTYGPFVFEIEGGTMYIFAPSLGILLSYNGNLVKICVSDRWLNKLCGACGQWNGDIRDDTASVLDQLTRDRLCPPRGTQATRMRCRGLIKNVLQECPAGIGLQQFMDHCAFDECVEQGASSFTLDALQEACTGRGDAMFAKKMEETRRQEEVALETPLQ